MLNETTSIITSTNYLVCKSTFFFLGGHLGRDKTFNKIRQRYYWPHMFADVMSVLSTCDACQRNNEPKRTLKQPMTTISVEPKAWHQVQHTCIVAVALRTSYFDMFICLTQIGMDLIGPLKKTKSGYVYILTVTDYYTKWAEAAPLTDKSAESVATSLVTMFYRLNSYNCNRLSTYFVHFLLQIWFPKDYNIGPRP